MEEKSKEGGPHTMERRFPKKFKVSPSGPDSHLDLGLPQAKKKLTFMLSSSADSRALRITFSGNVRASEESVGDRLEARATSGEVVEHFIPGFGVYGEEKTYDLPTPVEGTRLMARRSAEGDLTVWVSGYDLSEAENVQHGRKFVTVHRIGGKTVGYTIKDFLRNVNFHFNRAEMQLELE
ncbi:MAG: hypothetical protein AB1529_07760 [Candidatus Micrarchaeota archaeon]